MTKPIIIQQVRKTTHNKKNMELQVSKYSNIPLQHSHIHGTAWRYIYINATELMQEQPKFSTFMKVR